MAKLKVYAITKFTTRIEAHRNQCRAIVAAPSKKAAAEALHASMYDMNEFSEQTWNSIEEQVALSEPGIVFIAADDGPIVSTEQFTRVPNGERP